jgi:hypothetical protein
VLLLLLLPHPLLALLPRLLQQLLLTDHPASPLSAVPKPLAICHPNSQLLLLLLLLQLLQLLSAQPQPPLLTAPSPLLSPLQPRLRLLS